MSKSNTADHVTIGEGQRSRNSFILNWNRNRIIIVYLITTDGASTQVHIILWWIRRDSSSLIITCMLILERWWCSQSGNIGQQCSRQWIHREKL